MKEFRRRFELAVGSRCKNSLGTTSPPDSPFRSRPLYVKLHSKQARRAKASGFLVEMIFVAAGPVEEHIQRVKIRADAGGHSASEGSLREIYERGMRFLVTAFEENRLGNINILAVFHNPPTSPETGDDPQPALIVKDGTCLYGRDQGYPATLVPSRRSGHGFRN